MPYDHARKIGNEGDLVKHTVLSACVEYILSNSQGTFVYAESHAARAEYVLPEKGSWQNGIGILDRIAALHRLGHAKKFYDEFVKDRCCVGGRYVGSHSIAFYLAGEMRMCAALYPLKSASYLGSLWGQVDNSSSFARTANDSRVLNQRNAERQTSSANTW